MIVGGAESAFVVHYHPFTDEWCACLHVWVFVPKIPDTKMIEHSTVTKPPENMN